MFGEYPPVGFHFKVDFGLTGLKYGDVRFQDVSGISSEMETENIVEGGENHFIHKLPKRVKYSNLVLKRGALKDSGLINWISKTIDNYEISPTDIIVSLLNEEHQPLLTWKFMNAWPVKWSISDFKAMDNSLAVESIELTYSYFSRVKR